MFPKSATDLLQEVQAIQAGNGGQPIISMRTGVEQAAPLFSVKDIDQELADIVDHQTQMADAQAGSFGAGPGGQSPKKGAAGDDNSDGAAA
jgi:hypothetical protein